MATATVNDAPDLLAPVRRATEAFVRLLAADGPCPPASADPDDPRLANLTTPFAELMRATLEAEAVVSDAVDAAGDPIVAAPATECLWPAARDTLAKLLEARAGSAAQTGRLVRQQLDRVVAELAVVLRTMAVVWPDLVEDIPDDLWDEVWKVRRTPLAYLRTVWNLLWSSIRHPLSDTTIDLETGRVLYHSQ